MLFFQVLKEGEVVAAGGEAAVVVVAAVAAEVAAEVAVEVVVGSPGLYFPD